MKKFSDTYTNGEVIGHHDGETIKYSNKLIAWNEMCCHHCGGTALNFGHLAWGKLESTKKDTVSWGVGPQAYDILHIKVWCFHCGIDKPFFVQMQQYKNNLRMTTVPYTFEKTFDEIFCENYSQGEKNGVRKEKKAVQKRI